MRNHFFSNRKMSFPSRWFPALSRGLAKLSMVVSKLTSDGRRLFGDLVPTDFDLLAKAARFLWIFSSSFSRVATKNYFFMKNFYLSRGKTESYQQDDLFQLRRIFYALSSRACRFPFPWQNLSHFLVWREHIFQTHFFLWYLWLMQPPVVWFFQIVRKRNPFFANIILLNRTSKNLICLPRSSLAFQKNWKFVRFTKAYIFHCF